MSYGPAKPDSPRRLPPLSESANTIPVVRGAGASSCRNGTGGQRAARSAGV